MDNTHKRISICGTLLYLLVILIPIAGAFMQQNEKVDISFGARNLALLGNSIKLGLSVAAITITLGFFCALYIYNSKWLIGAAKYYFILLMPVPFYVYALSWMYLIKLLSAIWPELSRYSVSGIGACIFTETFAYFPIAIFFIIIGLQNIDVKRLEMASVYGEDNKSVWYIILPSILPYALAAGGLICVLSVTEFSVPSMFQYNTYALDIFSVYSRTGSALTAYVQCIPLTIILIVPIVWLIKNIKRYGIERREKTRFKLKIAGIPKVFMSAAFMLSILQVVVPTFVFVFSMDGTQNLLHCWKLISDELKNSFSMSVLGAAICMIITVAPADVLCWGKNRYITAVLFTAAVPGAIQAMGLLKFVNSSGMIFLEKSALLASLGCALKISPFVILWLCSFNMRVNYKAIEMARVFATNKLDEFKLIFVYYLPGIIIGFVLALFLIFAEESIPLILMAPGMETVTVKIYNYLHYGASEYVSAFALIVMMFIFLIELLFVILWKTVRRHSTDD